MIRCSYCYDRWILFATSMKGYYILYDISTDKIRKIRFGRGHVFFSLDVSMGPFIFVNSYDQTHILLGFLPELTIRRSNIGNINYATKFGDKILYADGTGHVGTYEPKNGKKVVLRESDEYYPEMVIEYRGRDGPFFKNGLYYVCWKTVEGNGQITELFGNSYSNMQFVGMAFCGNLLYGLVHNLGETVVYIIDCTTDKVRDRMVLRSEPSDSIFPFPGVYSNNILAKVDYNGKTYVFEDGVCTTVVDEHVVLCDDRIITFNMDDLLQKKTF